MGFASKPLCALSERKKSRKLNLLCARFFLAVYNINNNRLQFIFSKSEFSASFLIILFFRLNWVCMDPSDWKDQFWWIETLLSTITFSVFFFLFLYFAISNFYLPYILPLLHFIFGPFYILFCRIFFIFLDLPSFFLLFVRLFRYIAFYFYFFSSYFLFCFHYFIVCCYAIRIPERKILMHI